MPLLDFKSQLTHLCIKTFICADIERKLAQYLNLRY